jgi:apolipoprotein D and lipocalin family protein
MTLKILSILFIITATTIGCTSIPDGLEPVSGFEADRYLGTWYEVARLDHRFERGLSNVSATYSRGDNGVIHVLNKGYDAETGKWKQIEGRARFIDSESIGSLKVSFFGPFYGGYHIIELDRLNYGYSMVAGPSRSYLWILSRNKTLDENIYSRLVSAAAQKGFDTDRLILVQHDEAEKGMLEEKEEKKMKFSKMAGSLEKCPKTPNCVSSVDTSRGHYVAPLKFSGSAKQAQYRLLKVLNQIENARVMKSESKLVEAEFISAIFRFVDDAEFHMDETNKVIHVRSASRVGFSDLGVNRRRIEKIRKLFNENDDSFS